MAIPIKYNIRHLILRWRTTSLTVFAIALVVGVFVMVLALAQGLSHAFASSGDPLNVLVLRRGATSETNSALNRDQIKVLQYLSGLAQDASGRRLASAEVINLLNMAKVGGGSSNVIVRGVSAAGPAMRTSFKVIEGNRFRTGVRELVVGIGAARRFEGCAVGSRIRLAKSEYTVVGRFEAGGTAFESEFWGDTEELCREFDREGYYSSMLLRAPDRAAAEALMGQIKTNQQLASLNPRSEEKYYKDQTKSAAPIQFLGGFLAVVMAVGAIFAAMNTMYAAISTRGREIATLRVLGFSRRGILMAFVIESALLAAAGGVLGGLLALPVSGLSTGTMNFDSFSEISFFFRVTPGLFLGGLIFAAIMGVVGGFLPALQASRRPIIEALRET